MSTDLDLTHFMASALAEGVTSPAVLADAFYADIDAFLGEAPGQRESFDRLLEHLNDDDPGELWHAYLVGFGLGRAHDEESCEAVEALAAAFLSLPEPQDRQ